MSKRRFRVEFTGEAIIELDNAVIDEVDDEWRSVFYNLLTPCDIAEHIGYNLVINHRSLERLDGWADEQFRGLAKVVEDTDWEIYSEEIKPLKEMQLFHRKD